MLKLISNNSNTNHTLIVTILDKYHGRETGKETVWIIYVNSIYTLAIMLTCYKEDILSVSRKIASIRGIVRNISVIRNRKEETTWCNRDFVPLHGWWEFQSRDQKTFVTWNFYDTKQPHVYRKCMWWTRSVFTEHFNDLWTSRYIIWYV